ncbi:hypothetical protein E2C01_079315 [Portunus trituberculatus]|uniref:Uncharacterized protein n=1 Tax=Portunus trituberculatus TaxID=210409 RepID=A0A5B7IWK7_PORTR|nr:hypothetical protein [Portunus trituberculatus]
MEWWSGGEVGRWSGVLKSDRTGQWRCTK